MSTQEKKFTQPLFSLLQPTHEDFPYYALPENLRPVLDEAFAITKAPPELILATMFSAMSLAVQGIAKVSVSEHKTGSCGIFTLVIAEPSEGKSSCDRLFFKPFEEWENAEKKIADEKLARYKVEHSMWVIACQHIKNAIRREVKNYAHI